MQESQHIFIDEGWKALSTAGPANIFELGLGAGLNALASGWKSGPPPREREVIRAWLVQ